MYCQQYKMYIIDRIKKHKYTKYDYWYMNKHDYSE